VINYFEWYRNEKFIDLCKNVLHQHVPLRKRSRKEQILHLKPGMRKQWKRKHFEGRNWKRKRIQKHLTFWGAGSGSIFHKTWDRDGEAVKFLWKRKHFEERSWKPKQTRKRLTLYGAESGGKKYSTASTSLFKT